MSESASTAPVDPAPIAVAPPRSLSQRLAEALFAPVDIAPLVWFRIAFGLLMIYEVWEHFHYGWIPRYFIEPKFHFTYYGFGWVHPLPGDWMKVHFVALAVLGGAIAIGFCYRIATTLFFLGFTYMFLLEQARYLNHFYLICLIAFILIFVPAHRAFSVDALLRPALRSATAPAWSLWLLRGQICLVYFMGGVAKLGSDWLHGQPVRLWLADRMDFPVIGRFFKQDWMVYSISYGGLLFDLLITPLVLWRRTRWIGFVLATIFNVMNSRLFQIGVFPWLALSAVVILFSSKWLPRPFASLWGRADSAPVPAPAPAVVSNRARAVTLWLLASWTALQVLVPLRHWVLYPGNPEWSEEGHRFSWRMKLREKRGNLRIVARDSVSKAEWPVNLRDYATQRQLEEAHMRPDMLLQLCHYIADQWKREHGTAIELRVFAAIAFNGRPQQMLIDPDVDLAAQPRTLRHSTWIMPMTTPLGGGLKFDLGEEGKTGTAPPPPKP